MKVEEGPGAPGQLALDLPSCAGNSGLTEAPKKETQKPSFGWAQLLGQGSARCLSSDIASRRSSVGEADGCRPGEASATEAWARFPPRSCTVRTLFHVTKILPSFKN